MKNKHILWVPQYSLYDNEGKFVLSADSNWRVMCMTLPLMLKENPYLKVDIIVPDNSICKEDPLQLLHKALNNKHLNQVMLVPMKEIPRNAVQTRYDFDWGTWTTHMERTLNVDNYTHIYAHDPMLVRHLKALFAIKFKRSGPKHPIVITHTHFLDNPGNRVTSDDFQYWWGQIEGYMKADKCIWHCNSMKQVAKEALEKDIAPHNVESIMDKSVVWKSGYRSSDMSKEIDFDNVRFNLDEYADKKIIFVPNRVGGLGKSLDYTNNGAFLFDWINKLYEKRQDFIVVAGNPSQKISNDEINKLCKPYVKLVPSTINRDEYLYLCRVSNFVVGLYTNDTNGGLASLEAISMGTFPIFPDVYEYKHYFDNVKMPEQFRIPVSKNNNDVFYLKEDDVINTIDTLLSKIQFFDNEESKNMKYREATNCVFADLQSFVEGYATYENTVPVVMKELDLL